MSIQLKNLTITKSTIYIFFKIIPSACYPVHIPSRATTFSVFLIMSTSTQLYCDLSILNIIYWSIIMVNEDFSSFKHTHTHTHRDITSFSLSLILAIEFCQLGVKLISTVLIAVTIHIYFLGEPSSWLCLHIFIV